MSSNKYLNTYEEENEKKKDGIKSLLAYVSLKHFLTDPKQGYAGYHVMQSQIINILLVGRSQAGKSTLLATLLNPQQAVQGRGFSVTKEPQIQAFILNDEHNNISYTINIIDTPGLREKRIDDLQSRGDEEIIRLAGQCISNQITYLNIVIYVTVAKRTHELDAEAFKCIRDYLGKEFESSSLLVLSHCEEVPKQRFEQIVNDMKTFPETNEIINYCKLGVLPYGTMSADQLTLAEEDNDGTVEENEKALREKVHKTIKRIEKMRQDLFLAIIKTADKPRSISQLEGLMKIVKEQEKKLVDTALSAASEKWNKEKQEEIEQIREQNATAQEEEKKRYAAELTEQIELQNKKFQDEMRAKQEEERKCYNAELSKQLELQHKKFQEDLKAKQEEEKKLHLAALAKEREMQNKKFEEEMTAKQKEEKQRYQAELAKDRELQKKKFDEEMKRQNDEQKKEFEYKLQMEQSRQREEYEKQLNALTEEQRRDKARMYAEQLAKEAKERERQMTAELERVRQERARLYEEQQEKEAREKEQKRAEEFERRYHEEARLRAEQTAREAIERERKMAEELEKRRQENEKRFYEQQRREKEERDQQYQAKQEEERARANAEFQRAQQEQGQRGNAKTKKEKDCSVM